MFRKEFIFIKQLWWKYFLEFVRNYQEFFHNFYIFWDIDEKIRDFSKAIIFYSLFLNFCLLYFLEFLDIFFSLVAYFKSITRENRELNNSMKLEFKVNF